MEKDNGPLTDDNRDIDDSTEQEEVSSKPSGPLSVFPGKKHMVPALVLFLVFYAVSSLSIKYSAADQLSASGEKVFEAGEYWRIVTALAVHGDIVHLLSNGIVLIFFGWMLRAYFGLFVFPFMATVIGIITNVITVMLYDPSVSIIGCSGMTHGMVAFWLVLYLKHDVDNRFPRRILRAIGFFLVMVFPSAVQNNVSYLSHFVGFVAGMIAGVILIPVARVRDPS